MSAKKTFDEVARPGKCGVCGKKTLVATCASTLGPISFSYCRDCLAAGLEPYDMLVTYVTLAGVWPDDINADGQEMVRRQLREQGVKEEDFAADCKLELEAWEREGAL